MWVPRSRATHPGATLKKNRCLSGKRWKNFSARKKSSEAFLLQATVRITSFLGPAKISGLNLIRKLENTSSNPFWAKCFSSSSRNGKGLKDLLRRGELILAMRSEEHTP